MTVNVDSINPDAGDRRPAPAGSGLPRLTVAQTAARLGVKPETVYAYVSRGLLRTERGARGSTLDPLEVEGFAQRRRPARGGLATAGVAADKPGSGGSPLMVLDTDIAFIDDGELFLRGVPAAALAAEHDYESVALWLWGAPLEAGARFAVDLDGVGQARRAIATLPLGASTLDRIQTAVTVLGAADPLRHDATPEALRRVGAGLIRGIVLALAREAGELGELGDTLDRSRAAGPDAPSTAGREPRPAPALARQLWAELGEREATEAGIRALNAALVLMIDHDLAVSTLAARAAASARASGYAIVTSALGALDAALHGNASRAAVGLIGRVLNGEAVDAALAATVVRGAAGIPGFGHVLYPRMDDRAAALFRLLRPVEGAEPVLAAVDRLAGVVERRAGLHPNVDLALAALALATGMRADAGTAIFALGRMGGWIAHALDEYGQAPLRLRPHGRYTGPRPE